MRVMMMAFLATAVITLGAWVLLGNSGFSSAEKQVSETVRLPEPTN